jgi:hypothetical protein
VAFFALLSLGASIVAACTNDDQAATTKPRCKDDTECPGDKVCTRGKCVAPTTSTSSSGAGGQTGEDACTRFVACSFQVAPATAASTSAAYGPGGACWTTQAADACRQACQTGLEALHAANPGVSQCALCQSDPDCGGATPACDSNTGECVPCTSDANCQAPTTHCDVGTHSCVMPPCQPTGTCGSMKCGTVPDGCGGLIDCGACDDFNDCTADSCVAGQCKHVPEADLSVCGSGRCLSGVCATVHASCIASDPNATAYFTYYVNPDPQGMDGWDVGDECVCNGNTLETLFNGSLGPTITVTCSKCVEASFYGDRYCFQ